MRFIAKQRKSWSLMLLVVTLVVLAWVAVPLAQGATMTVTRTADSGPGTLREALTTAVSGDVIVFDPTVFAPDAPASIALASQLPTLDQGNVTIYASNAGVIVDGSGTPEDTVGIRITSNGNTIKGLQILYFPVDGMVIKDGAQNNTIGGDRTVGAGPTGEGNVISGNSRHGIRIEGSGTMSNTIIGNYIGTDVSGAAAISNSGAGVRIGEGAQYNVIGGDTPEERNVISGNGGPGVSIEGSGTDANTVIGNYIGTDASGTADLGNSGQGVTVWNGAQSNTIGGDTPGERNVIGGNGRYGIHICDEGTDGNVVSGNYISGDASGTADLGNSYDGVLIDNDAQNNTIGGSAPGEGNVSAHNGGVGVLVDGSATTGNTISRNSITANGGLGIDNLNGGNTELIPPTIVSASCSSVSGTTPANSTVEIFSDPADEGKRYEGTTTADATGAFTWTGSTTGPNVTATATDGAGNTSEFSDPLALVCYRVYLPLVTKNYQ